MSFSLRKRQSIAFKNTFNRVARFYSGGISLRPLTVAPLQYEFVFKKVFTDRVNMRCLLNDIIIAARNSNLKRIVTVHNVEVSDVTPADDGDPSVLYDSCCTFIDGSMGSFKLLRTHDSETISHHVRDIAKLDYWQQWKEHGAFAYPIQIAVMENTTFSHYCNSVIPRVRTIQLDLRHACPGLHNPPPPITIAAFNLHTGRRTLSECTNDFERWCVIIRDSYLFEMHNLPGLCKLQPFQRAVHMLDVQKLSLQEMVELFKVTRDKMERNKAKFFEVLLFGEEFHE